MHIHEGKEADCELNFEIAIIDALHAKWETATHRSKFEYYCNYINRQYWEAYKMRLSEAQAHIRTPMPQRVHRAITLMHMRSHILRIETGGWPHVNEKKRLCTTCDINKLENEEHISLECPAYTHIRDDFKPLLQGCTTLEDLLGRAQPSPTTLGMSFVRLLELLAHIHKS